MYSKRDKSDEPHSATREVRDVDDTHHVIQVMQTGSEFAFQLEDAKAAVWDLVQ
jgi:hypothetical protein